MMFTLEQIFCHFIESTFNGLLLCGHIIIGSLETLELTLRRVFSLMNTRVLLTFFSDEHCLF